MTVLFKETFRKLRLEGGTMAKGWYFFAFICVIALSIGLPYWLVQRGLKELNPEARKGLPGQFVQLSNGYTHFQWHGPENGPVVVLVHGATQSSYIWDNVVPFLTEAGLWVLRYDNFGRGYSDRPHVVYNLDLYDKQLMELLAALKVKTPVSIVGLSQGGGITVTFAARHPKLVKKMVLCAPVGFSVKLPFLAKLTRAPLVGDWLMTVFGKQVLLGQAGRHLNNESMAKEMREKMAEQLKYKGYLPALLSMLRNYPMHHMSNIYNQAAKHNIPTLLIWGDADSIVPFRHSKKILALMPTAKLEVVPGGNHTLVYEEAAKTCPAMVKFLSE
jgi:pimeloyl-ACP methyl ester carboxylesterase